MPQIVRDYSVTGGGAASALIPGMFAGGGAGADPAATAISLLLMNRQAGITTRREWCKSVSRSAVGERRARQSVRLMTAMKTPQPRAAW